MRLVIKKDGKVINEFQFNRGPVNIGRHADSQIFLADRTVSRHHAVIFFSIEEHKWMAEDLDSANKTYLNSNPIRKAGIKTGDIIRINDFTIDVNLEDETVAAKAINLGDTLSKTAYSMDDTLAAASSDDTSLASSTKQTVTRRIDADHAPDIKLPAKRARDYISATEAICRTKSLDEMLNVLLRIAAKQFTPFHAWCALRNQPSGPMTCHAGKHQNSSKVELVDIKLNNKITEAVDKKQFLLFPRIPPADGVKEIINSAMIAPVIGQSGCFGVLYIDNDMSHEHYSLSDLDYLMLITIHTAVILENF
jgi:pSer/pThr/pTyr-binding forkhead associated (FHA) protein